MDVPNTVLFKFDFTVHTQPHFTADNIPLILVGCMYRMGRFFGVWTPEWLDKFRTYLSEELPQGISPGAFFDPAYYVEQVKNALEETITEEHAVAHWILKGYQRGLSPSPLWDAAEYQALNPNLSVASLFQHFLVHGVPEGRRFNSFIRLDQVFNLSSSGKLELLPSMEFPRGANREVLEASDSPELLSLALFFQVLQLKFEWTAACQLYQFSEPENFLKDSSRLFNAAARLKRNGLDIRPPDLRNLIHLIHPPTIRLAVGEVSDDLTTPNACAAYLLETLSDVDIGPFLDRTKIVDFLKDDDEAYPLWLRYITSEAARTFECPNDWFSADAYLSANPHLAISGAHAWQHFLIHGSLNENVSYDGLYQGRWVKQFLPDAGRRHAIVQDYLSDIGKHVLPNPRMTLRLDEDFRLTHDLGDKGDEWFTKAGLSHAVKDVQSDWVAQELAFAAEIEPFIALDGRDKPVMFKPGNLWLTKGYANFREAIPRTRYDFIVFVSEHQSATQTHAVRDLLIALTGMGPVLLAGDVTGSEPSGRASFPCDKISLQKFYDPVQSPGVLNTDSLLLDLIFGVRAKHVFQVDSKAFAEFWIKFGSRFKGEVFAHAVVRNESEAGCGFSPNAYVREMLPDLARIFVSGSISPEELQAHLLGEMGDTSRDRFQRLSIERVRASILGFRDQP